METKILKQMTTTQKEIPNLILKATLATTVCFISNFLRSTCLEKTQLFYVVHTLITLLRIPILRPNRLYKASAAKMA